MMCLIHSKNLCKCCNVPPSSTTINGKQRIWRKTKKKGGGLSKKVMKNYVGFCRLGKVSSVSQRRKIERHFFWDLLIVQLDRNKKGKQILNKLKAENVNTRDNRQYLICKSREFTIYRFGYAASEIPRIDFILLWKHCRKWALIKEGVVVGKMEYLLT
jgi:hypothetical protein